MKKKTAFKLISFAALLVAAVVISIGLRANAASVGVVSINYSKSEITVQLSQSDTVLLISDKNQKKWELMPDEKDEKNQVTIDISWISMAKDYVLSLKGDVSDNPVSVTIPKRVTNFKATYSMLNSSMTFSGSTSGRTVEWKKKEGLEWNTYDEKTFPNDLAGLCANGASLIFRLAPINGTGINNPGERPSKEITVTIPKKTTAPTVTINDSALTIALTKGMQYRYLQTENGNPMTDQDGNYIDWVDVTKTEDVPLSTIAPKVLYSNSNTTPTEVYMQFRTKATSSTQMSANTSITIPVQQEAIKNDDEQVTLKYTSSTTFQIQVLYASTDDPYEYCILDAETLNGAKSIEGVDPLEIKWKTISSTTPVTFTEDTDGIEEGSLVYVRKKAVGKLGEDDYELASQALALTDTSGIKFPGDVTVENGIIWLQTIAGVCNTSNAAGQITFTMYSPTETTIKTLSFVDYNNKTAFGEVDIKSSVSENIAADKDDDKKYIITTTIKSTKNIESHTKTRMLAYITFASGSKYESTPLAGIGMYIYPATEVDNPTTNAEKIRIGEMFDPSYDLDNDYVDYSTAFNRVYMSTKEYPKVTRAQEDDKSFKFLLQLGTIYPKKLGKLDEPLDINDEVYVENGKLTTITKIKYDGVELGDGCYTVQYKNDKSDEDEDILLALVTIHADKIEAMENIDERNNALPLIIYLSNGEILDDKVTLNLRNTATVDAAPIAWSLTAGSLELVKETTTTSASGATSTTKEKVYDYIIDLTLFSSSYSVGVSDVKWKDTSVYDKATVSGGKIQIYLSNEKINEISVTSSQTEYLVITFDNGFVIKDSCKMTILKAAGTTP